MVVQTSEVIVTRTQHTENDEDQPGSTPSKATGSNSSGSGVDRSGGNRSSILPLVYEEKDVHDSGDARGDSRFVQVILLLPMFNLLNGMVVFVQRRDSGHSTRARFQRC